MFCKVKYDIFVKKKNKKKLFQTTVVRMMNAYHHTKPEPSGFLAFLETAEPLNLNLGSWGPYPIIFRGQKVAYVSLRTCLISVQSLGPVATVGEEKEEGED